MATSFPSPEPSPSGSDWERVITDPDERKVFGALADPKWDFRTIAGLSKDTGLQPDNVSQILEKYPQLVRMSSVPDPKGNILYTLRSRRPKLQEILAMARDFMAGSVN
jgi:hypothetical protein